MCCINEDALVSDTQLLVASNSNKTSQLTVYSNNVDTNSTNNMMILPVPNPETIKFIDLSDYTRLFRDLNLNFIKQYAKGSRGAVFLNSYSSSLKVHEVGSYLATIVPTHQQLNNIDRNTFGTVNKFLSDTLSKYYQKDVDDNFGYIVCKLKSGNHGYHPFAYTHKIANDGKLFVPTRHLHGSSDFNSMFGNSNNEQHADWDHQIFSFNTVSESGNSTNYNNHENYVNFNKIPFNFGTIHSLNKLEIKQQNQNDDLNFNTIWTR
jgi:hypothetical protein